MAFRLGVVMLNTRFPRLPGDIGNPETFPFPVAYRRVEAARVAAVVRDGAVLPEAARGLTAAVRELAELEQVSLIASSCGYLGALQDELQAAAPRVPVVASAFALLPFLRAAYGASARLGVLTFDSRRLAPVHFGPWLDEDGAANVVIEGIEAGRELHRVISEDRPELDREAAEADVLDAGHRLMARDPEIAALLLECTNLSPYRRALAAALGRPVYDLSRAIAWVAAGSA